MVRHFDAPDPDCETCGAKRKRAISTFGIVRTGILSRKYNDRKLEGSTMEGHWVKATDPATGKRTKDVFIETFQQQKEFCKQEGYHNPWDLGPAEAGADGKSISTRGLPGSW